MDPIQGMEARVHELEQLVSRVRHSVHGALTPALLVADRLRADPDPRMRQAGEKIARSIMRAVELLAMTRTHVPARHKADCAAPGSEP
jgi:hypothetical protein